MKFTWECTMRLSWLAPPLTHGSCSLNQSHLKLLCCSRTDNNNNRVKQVAIPEFNKKNAICKYPFESNSGEELSTELHNKTIQEYCKIGDVDNAMKLVAQLEAMGFHPNSISYGFLIDSLGSVGRTLEADVLFQEMMYLGFKPRIRLFNALLKGFLKKGLLGLAVKFLVEMDRMGVCKNQETYEILLDYYVSAGRLEDTWMVVNEMKTNGIQLSSFVYGKVIRLYRDNGMWKKAIGLVEEIREKGISLDRQIYNSIIDTLGKYGELGEAIELFEKMKQESIVPDITTWNSLIRWHCKAGDLTKALQLFTEMQEQGLYPDPKILMSLISRLGELGKWDVIKKNFENMKCRGRQEVGAIYAMLVDIYGQYGRFQDAEDFISALKSEGFLPSASMFCVLANAYAQQGFCEQTVKVLQLMEAEGIELNIIMLNVLINAFGIAGRHEEALSIYQHIRESGISPDVVTYSTLMKAFIRAKKFDKVPEIYKEMESYGCTPDRKARQMLQTALMCFHINATVVGALNFTESAVYIHFDQTPPPWSRFSTSIFRYSFERPDGSKACRNNSCSIYCELDGQRLKPCHVGNLVLKNLTANRKHNFLLNVTTHNGDKNSSAYSWFIDTIPPTAKISSEQNYTNAEKITVDITFSEACTRHGGFSCLNSSNCDVIVDGPAHVQPSSLSTIEPNIKYSFLLVLPFKSIYGRVVVTLADEFCKDRAGNNFTRSNTSTIIIHFDRRPVLVDLWSSVPSYELEINGVPRTVFATNGTEDLEVYVDFSIPVINSTEQILNALNANFGSLIPVNQRTHGNSRFAFKLKNIASKTEIITVKLQASLLIGRTGTPVSPVNSLTFLYDCKKPGIGLSTSSENVTKDSNINIIVEFTKPVFGFGASVVEVNGGRLIRFKELSRALYSFTVMAITNNMVSVSIPEGKVNDISGNMNVASNRLEIVHYSTPAISTALHSFVTAGVLATTLAAAALSLASSNLGAIARNNYVASDPSMNLHGMIGHLQVFVLSDWLLADQPIEYSETTKGLRWLIPRQKLPWKKNGSSLWPNNVYLDLGRFLKRRRRAYHAIGLINWSYMPQKLLFPTEIDPKFHGRHNISKENTPFGLPLSSNEYFTFFLRGEPLSAGNVVKKLQNYKGWQDMEMNLFWLSIGVGSLLLLHSVLLVFLKWRIGTAAQWMLSVPRFELLLLILALPCISQSAAFVIRGGTIEGIITGALLLAIPAAFILSVCLFLTIAVFTGSFAQYKEIIYGNPEEQWHKKLWFFIVGRPAYGKWFYMDGLPSLFLSCFGILFDDHKGPPMYVFVDQNDTNTVPRWVGSGQNGIGRMRAVSSDESHEEMKIPLPMRFLGCARSSYIVLDLLRRVCLGVIAGSYSTHRSSQSLCALMVTLGQFICLFTLKPHIRRGVYIVESISLLSEATIFGLSLSMNKSNSIRAKTLGFLMLALLFLSFVSQLVNEWYALINFILNLSQPHKSSFKLGLKFAAKGLLLPFLPRKHWSRVIPGSSQAKSVLVPVLPQFRETELARSNQREPRVGQLSSMTATIVPLLSPSSGSPIVQATGTTGETTLTTQKNDMKKLRQLAKASFSGQSKDENTNASYRFRLESFSHETVSNDPQTSTSNVMK